MTMVSLFCEDDNDCVINNNDNADGHWTIGRQVNGVRLADSAEGLWPHQVKSWEYWSRGWQPDPQLTVTGNISKAPPKKRTRVLTTSDSEYARFFVSTRVGFSGGGLPNHLQNTKFYIQIYVLQLQIQKSHMIRKFYKSQIYTPVVPS